LCRLSTRCFNALIVEIKRSNWNLQVKFVRNSLAVENTSIIRCEKEDHNQIDDPVVMQNNCVLILIGKNSHDSHLDYDASHCREREKEKYIHSFLVSFSTHQGACLPTYMLLLLCIPLQVTFVFGD
jgi:hypothetical protein